jgi:hypothetical protein
VRANPGGFGAALTEAHEGATLKVLQERTAWHVRDDVQLGMCYTMPGILTVDPSE